MPSGPTPDLSRGLAQGAPTAHWKLALLPAYPTDGHSHPLPSVVPFSQTDGFLVSPRRQHQASPPRGGHPRHSKFLGNSLCPRRGQLATLTSPHPVHPPGLMGGLRDTRSHGQDSRAPGSARPERALPAGRGRQCPGAASGSTIWAWAWHRSSVKIVSRALPSSG